MRETRLTDPRFADQRDDPAGTGLDLLRGAAENLDFPLAADEAGERPQFAHLPAGQSGYAGHFMDRHLVREPLELDRRDRQGRDIAAGQFKAGPRDQDRSGAGCGL